MRDSIKKIYLLVPLLLLLTLAMSFNPAFAPSSLASSFATRAGKTTGWANVRTGPSTNFSLVRTYAPNTAVTVYATVSGQVVWSGISTWYRISSLSNSPLYIYGGLVTFVTGSGGSPSPQGKVIVISLSKQTMTAFQNGKQVYFSLATSGQPALRTPTGTYHIFAKLSPTTFYSPWPPGSPYWYPPTHINYALEWKAGGFFLHDSWWRTVYGPGTNVWHFDPVYGWMTGTHGCVTMPLRAVAWLYNWAPIGTTVQINP
ncbi:MAG TPA: L,D-transpeptidase family protein [Ktedonosporobacter sp.]|nr:L,D-transpeptidase family protein [Ktedonosporobacter sp.]